MSQRQQQEDPLDPPLSWHQARSRLRTLLQQYVANPPPPRRRSHENDTSQTTESVLSKWVRRDYDLYTGLAVSLALLVVSCCSLSAAVDGDDFDNNNQSSSSSSRLRPTASLPLYRAHVAASALLVAGSCASLWMVRRRRFLGLNDSDNAKRREILRFLRALQWHEEKADSTTTKSLDHAASVIRFNGNSLNDIYPVYRTSCCSDDTSGRPSWTHIPSQLLVEGDYIALQIGDIAPTKCRLVIDKNNNNDDNNTTASNHHGPVQVAAGEQLSLETFGETLGQLEALPKGRSTITTGSEHLLTLCNKKSIFQVIDTPLQEFIHRPAVTSRPSQASRRVKAVRQSLSLLAGFMLFSTSLIVYGRASSPSADYSLLVPIPLLAALGVFPVVAPFFLFFLEVLGTARVLVTVHPYASSTVTTSQETTGSDGTTTTTTTTTTLESSFPRTRLLIRYITATGLSRLSLWRASEWIGRMLARVCPFGSSPGSKESSKLVRVPPASLDLLEKLGVATAFCLIDDELACEPAAIPQQLLIPSGMGLKLLDLCPTLDDDHTLQEFHDSSSFASRQKRRRSFDSDSESEDGSSMVYPPHPRRKVVHRRTSRRTIPSVPGEEKSVVTNGGGGGLFEVQFEDPTWWQYLPSLKCIGLACLMLDEKISDQPPTNDSQDADDSQIIVDNNDETSDFQRGAELALVKSVCRERRDLQLASLAHCIGFSTAQNANGSKGDISAFSVRMRMHILSSALVQERMVRDAHERSIEQSRWWGLVRPDSTSVVVEDKRTSAFQLLTVGDPSVVVDLCHEAWQGEISTILPLGAVDRQTIIETTNNWKLADLDVSAFSYSPVPRSLEPRLSFNPDRKVYLLDHVTRGEHSYSLHRDKTMSLEWSFMKNQIFLGVLGSLVVPRREIQHLLSTLSDAGVRFVYFSPRNMRRQKELASQMGIDVSWNCAISLRPVESGEDDPYRMVSNYADWDVNAKLPHGVEDVRKHLEEVDNVPLLVSLYTDVTKGTTKEMVEIFQDYCDTVISVGLSHLPSNDAIFSASDIAVGIDVLTEDAPESFPEKDVASLSAGHVLPAEVEFVSSIAAHSCAFRFRGGSSVSHISSILEQARGALDSSVASAMFVLFGLLSFSFFVLFSVCTPATVIPFVPTFGSVLFLQGVVPIVGFTLAMSDTGRDAMKRVPPKNDQSITFARKEGWKLYTIVVLQAIPPALLPQLLHLIVFGEILLHFEPDVASTSCPSASNWIDVVRCSSLQDYSGPAKISAGVVVLGQFALCVIVSSAAFVGRLDPLWGHAPWSRNHAWVVSSLLSLGLTALYMRVAVEYEVAAALPWYYYILAAVIPVFCLFWIEICKRAEIKLEWRAEKLRRLQFETRLGAWSPR